MKKLPKSLTHVTGFSKLLACLLIVIFFLVAFFSGMMYQRVYAPLLSHITPTPTPILTSIQTSCKKDSDCILEDTTRTSSCCPSTSCLDFSLPQVQAVNRTWFQVSNLSRCTRQVMCPMIYAKCSNHVLQNNTRFESRCMDNVCQKTIE